MARTLSAPLIAALQAGTIYPALLVAVEWQSGVTRYWTGQIDKTFMGETFTAAGNLLQVSAVQETVELRAQGITVQLSGINPAVLALALNERRQGKPVQVWLALLDAADVELDTPILLFDGRVDVPRISIQPTGGVVSVSAESRMIDLQRARRSRYTDEDQQARYPGDLGCAFVKRIQGKQLLWGGVPSGRYRNPLRPDVPSSDGGP